MIDPKKELNVSQGTPTFSGVISSTFTASKIPRDRLEDFPPLRLKPLPPPPTIEQQCASALARLHVAIEANANYASVLVRRSFEEIGWYPGIGSIHSGYSGSFVLPPVVVHHMLHESFFNGRDRTFIGELCNRPTYAPQGMIWVEKTTGKQSMYVRGVWALMTPPTISNIPLEKSPSLTQPFVSPLQHISNFLKATFNDKRKRK